MESPAANASRADAQNFLIAAQVTVGVSFLIVLIFAVDTMGLIEFLSKKEEASPQVAYKKAQNDKVRLQMRLFLWLQGLTSTILSGIMGLAVFGVPFPLNLDCNVLAKMVW